MSYLKALISVLVIVVMTGCASITGSEMQQLSLTTKGEDSNTIDGVKCTLQNDKGTWEATSPGFVNIHRSAEDLTVQCKKDGQKDGLLKAVSRAAGSMFGNIVFGGGIGAIIDHNKGNGYNYPDRLPVEMGKSVVVDRKNQDTYQATTSAMPMGSANAGAQLQGNAVRGFDDYRTKPSPKAFAIADKGHWASVTGRTSLSPDAAAMEAVNSCKARGFVNCRLYAVNSDLIGQ